MLEKIILFYYLFLKIQTETKEVVLNYLNKYELTETDLKMSKRTFLLGNLKLSCLS